MKKQISIPGLTLLGGVTLLTGCSEAAILREGDNVISVCASESPHARILNEAVRPLLAEKGYTLNVSVLDWTLQNDSVYKGDYDANYFQHRPYLEQYDSGSANYVEDYTYTRVFPAALVHYEPLRVYEGKSSAADFESKKTTATYEICSDVSNEIRALDLLVANGVITGYEKDSDGNPINLPKNISLIDENQLVAQKGDYDYAVLPCNTALTGNLAADDRLPAEGGDVADLRANIIAANVQYYKSNATYKTKIDALVEAVLDSSVSEYITKTWSGIISVDQKSLLA